MLLVFQALNLKKIIEDRLAETIPGAEVTVLVLSVTGNRVYVIGKVVRPGEFIMSSQMTVAQVLSLAGGLDRFANGGSIKVQRIEKGIVTYFEYDYGDLLFRKKYCINGLHLKSRRCCNSTIK